MDPGPDPTPDPTPLFGEFKDAKKISFFTIFFSYNLPPTGTLSSVLKMKFFAKIFLLKSFFASIISEKGRSRIRIRTTD
jgi:hypothetical protein